MSRPVLEQEFPHQLLPEGPWLVALSGGGDSVALLHLMVRLGYSVEAAHLDHALRPESEADRIFCQQLCARLEVPFHWKRVEVAAPGASSEAAGREARYRFLAELELPVVTAHTLDDQAETVLMRCIEGCGLAGLGGIDPQRQDGVYRPLLGFRRSQLRDYLEALGEAWLEDPSNQSEQPRARVRHQLLPTLEEWNPRVCRALAGLSEEARRTNHFLEGLARQELDRHPNRQRLSVRRLQALHPALQRQVLRLACPQRLGRVHLEALVELLDKESGKRVLLPGQRQVRRQQGELILEDQQSSPPLPAPAPLDLTPGRHEFSAFKLRLMVEEAAPAAPTASTVVLDADRLTGTLMIRSRRPGDKMRLPARPGTQSLKKIFQERTIPQHERDFIPVLAHRGAPVWLVGHCVDVRYLADQSTRRAYRLQAETLTQE
ncbi:MAG: tRNA lysidine(34) synthetase TilS [Candidatus Eremiobacteraeota bacterium]|nr:tRNA lysidine(34) synthetase TilS [Candidatus Eremiobacteraeota bacterium]